MSKTDPFSISVNARHEFAAQPAEALALDVLKIDERFFHLLQDGKTQHIELVEANYAARRYVFRIGGQRFEVSIDDHYERLVKELGLSVGSSQKMNTIKAPMPGLVLNVLVEPGQQVQKGDTLLILEAMKMENVLKAVGDGKVKAIKVQKGAAVDKGQLLLEME